MGDRGWSETVFFATFVQNDTESVDTRKQLLYYTSTSCVLTRNSSRERSDSEVTGFSACDPVTPFATLSAFPAAIGDLETFSHGIGGKNV